LDDHECGETKDRKPPGVGYHYVTPVWQSFFLGNIEKELHETSEQRRANVVDILSSADAVAVSQARRRRYGTVADGQCRIESSRVKSQKDALSVQDV
jgi:hypothetical protein